MVTLFYSHRKLHHGTTTSGGEVYPENLFVLIGHLRAIYLFQHCIFRISYLTGLNKINGIILSCHFSHAPHQVISFFPKKNFHHAVHPF